MGRSQACALLVNGETEDEIRAAIARSPALRSDIPVARAGAEAESLTILDLPDAGAEHVLAEIAAFIALTGGAWPPEHRQEFINQAAAELCELPASIVVKAIRVARKRIYQPQRFVSWIYESTETDVSRLAAELDRLRQLDALAKE